MNSEKKAHFPGFLSQDEKGNVFILHFYPKCISLGKNITDPGKLHLLVISGQNLQYADKEILQQVTNIVNEFFGDKINVGWSVKENQSDEVICFSISGQGVYRFYMNQNGAFCSFH